MLACNCVGLSCSPIGHMFCFTVLAHMVVWFISLRNVGLFRYLSSDELGEINIDDTL